MNSVNDLRANLREYRQRVQFRKEQIEFSYYGCVVGVLMPVEEAERLQLNVVENSSLRDFRAGLTRYWERLQSDLDCVFLTAHDSSVAAFVSPRLVSGAKKACLV